MFKCVYLAGVWDTLEVPRLFGKGRRVVSDNRSVDGADLARQIEGACNEFERNGYSIVSIVPKESGIGQGYAGWSYTAGVLIVASRPTPER